MNRRATFERSPDGFSARIPRGIVMRANKHPSPSGEASGQRVRPGPREDAEHDGNRFGGIGTPGRPREKVGLPLGDHDARMGLPPTPFPTARERGDTLTAGQNEMARRVPGGGQALRMDRAVDAPRADAPHAAERVIGRHEQAVTRFDPREAPRALAWPSARMPVRTSDVRDAAAMVSSGNMGGGKSETRNQKSE